MSINKFTNNLDGTPFHSHGYADVSNGGTIGSVSSQSFAQRRQIERNRQTIGGYHLSRVANGHHRSMQYQRADAPSQRTTGESSVPRPGYGNARTSSGVSSPQPRQHFTEPPTRSYNPYK